MWVLLKWRNKLPLQIWFMIQVRCRQSNMDAEDVKRRQVTEAEQPKISKVTSAWKTTEPVVSRLQDDGISRWLQQKYGGSGAEWCGSELMFYCNDGREVLVPVMWNRKWAAGIQVTVVCVWEKELLPFWEACVCVWCGAGGGSPWCS